MCIPFDPAAFPFLNLSCRRTYSVSENRCRRKFITALSVKLKTKITKCPVVGGWPEPLWSVLIGESVVECGRSM